MIDQPRAAPASSTRQQHLSTLANAEDDFMLGMLQFIYYILLLFI